MPRLLEIGKYVIFIWANEAGEPIHIHIAAHRPAANASKLWLTKYGTFIVAHNKSKIPQRELNEIIDLLTLQWVYICNEWMKFFSVSELNFYC